MSWDLVKREGRLGLLAYLCFYLMLTGLRERESSIFFVYMHGERDIFMLRAEGFR